MSTSSPLVLKPRHIESSRSPRSLGEQQALGRLVRDVHFDYQPPQGPSLQEQVAQARGILLAGLAKGGLDAADRARLAEVLASAPPEPVVTLESVKAQDPELAVAIEQMDACRDGWVYLQTLEGALTEEGMARFAAVREAARGQDVAVVETAIAILSGLPLIFTGGSLGILPALGIHLPVVPMVLTSAVAGSIALLKMGAAENRHKTQSLQDFIVEVGSVLQALSRDPEFGGLVQKAAGEGLSKRDGALLVSKVADTLGVDPAHVRELLSRVEVKDFLSGEVLEKVDVGGGAQGKLLRQMAEVAAHVLAADGPLDAKEVGAVRRVLDLDGGFSWGDAEFLRELAERSQTTESGRSAVDRFATVVVPDGYECTVHGSLSAPREGDLPGVYLDLAKAVAVRDDEGTVYAHRVYLGEGAVADPSKVTGALLVFREEGAEPVVCLLPEGDLSAPAQAA